MTASSATPRDSSSRPRIVFASYALPGHINKCLVLADELAGRGYPVFFATQDEGQAWLGPGVRHVPWQPQVTAPVGRGFVEHLRAVRGAMSEEPERYRRMAIAANAAADIYTTAFDSLETALLPVEPDLLIVPQVLDPGIDLAHRRQWPLIILAFDLPAAVRRGRVATATDGRSRWPSVVRYLAYARALRRRHRARETRAAGVGLDDLFRRATIAATTDSSIEGHQAFTPNVHLVGPIVPDPLPPLPVETERWLERQPTGIVLAAFGTLVRLGERQVTSLGDALAGCGVSVLWALPERHHGLVKARWPSIRVETFVPQVTLLSRDAVRAFVTHAGANSAVEAMYWGRPILGLPFMFDQHHFASRAVDLSVGLALDPHAFTSAQVRDAVRRLVLEPRFAAAARELSTRLKRTPGVKGAADLVEREIAGGRRGR